MQRRLRRRCQRRQRRDPAPGVAGAEPAPTPKQAAGGTFRETLWFKKGDVDQMVAEARARVEAARGKGPAPEAEPEAPAEDARPLEDRYVDDGTVTTEDRKKFSLRTGGNRHRRCPPSESVPGERMSEAEMVGEIGGRKRMVIIGGAVAVALAVVAVVALGFRGKNVAKSATAMAPVAVPVRRRPACAAASVPAPPAPAPAAAAPQPAARRRPPPWLTTRRPGSQAARGLAQARRRQEGQAGKKHH